jgi:hypothetical protein
MTVELEGAAAVEQARYFIDRGWFDQHNLAFDDMVLERVCDSCRGRLGEEVEERYTVFDRKSGRSSFEFRRVTYGSNPVRVIRECCGKKKGYITPDMPTLEAIFRIYLANGNQPMPLEHVREQLAEWCPGGGCQWVMLPSETLARLVESDRYYGLRRHSAGA